MLKYIINFFILVTVWMQSAAFAQASHTETAIFAMGCFWCGESAFRTEDANALLPGVISVRVGYAGGTEINPTYEHHPGYKEAVKIVYNPEKIAYKKLLNIFWNNVDPLDAKGQFCDKGFPYTAVIFYMNENQKEQALITKEAVQKKLSSKIIATEIIKSTSFYDAEEYHQNYKLKNPVRYKYYRWNCGRDQRLKALWEDKQA